MLARVVPMAAAGCVALGVRGVVGVTAEAAAVAVVVSAVLVPIGAVAALLQDPLGDPRPYLTEDPRTG